MSTQTKSEKAAESQNLSTAEMRKALHFAQWPINRGTWFSPDGRTFTSVKAAHAAMMAVEDILEELDKATDALYASDTAEEHDRLQEIIGQLETKAEKLVSPERWESIVEGMVEKEEELGIR